tara:strand:+ start:529 stop:1107 length:579 start_codon:yes stop_codon:yes gene_type:complete
LILQYNKGPAIEDLYSRWSIYPGVNINRINTDQQNTSPKLTLGVFIQAENKVSKTVGFVSGLNYCPVRYSYNVIDSLVQDRLFYFNIPLGIKLIPTKRSNIILGANYNIYNNGNFIVSKDSFKRSEVYSEGVFRNTIGGYVQMGYKFYGNFEVFMNFRWARRSSPAIQVQTNNTSGFQLGISYLIWNSEIKY